MPRIELFPFPAPSGLAVIAMLACGAACALGDDPIPKAFSRERYDAVRAHSPFAVATAEAPPAPPQASFAANWFVSGIARIGDADFVTIKSRDLGKQFSLATGEEVEGVQVASVNWSELVGKTTVILRKGTETAKLEFNEAEVHAAPAATPGKTGPGGPAGGKAPQASPSSFPPMPVLGRGVGTPPPPMGTGTPTNSVRHRPQVIMPPK